MGLYEFGGSKGNNIVSPAGNLFAVLLEPREVDPRRRYKGIIWHEPPYVKREGYFLYTSPDGLRWTRQREAPIIPMGITSQLFPARGIGDALFLNWDKRLGKYVANGKVVMRTVPRKDMLDGPNERIMRTYVFMESDDLLHWTSMHMVMYPDALDGPDAQIYRHATFYYESMWIGFLGKMQTERRGEKTTEVQLSASRDGRHWTRVGRREAFLPLSAPGQWDAAYSAPAIPPILMGDELWIYYRSAPSVKRGSQGKNSIGLATLRRDGFVSLNSGATPGRIVTRPLTFRGSKLYVNADISKGGYIKAELQTHSGKTIEPYTLAECLPATGNVMAWQIKWKGKETIPLENTESLRLVFELKNAKLYSFWLQ